jgi:hypothetical protein
LQYQPAQFATIFSNALARTKKNYVKHLKHETSKLERFLGLMSVTVHGSSENIFLVNIDWRKKKPSGMKTFFSVSKSILPFYKSGK